MAKPEPTMTIRVDCEDFKSAADRFAESFERFERTFYTLRPGQSVEFVGGEDVAALKSEVARLNAWVASLKDESARHERDARILSDAFTAAKERAAEAEQKIESLRNRPATLQRADNVIAELRRKLAEATGTATFDRGEPYDLLRKQRDEARAERDLLLEENKALIKAGAKLTAELEP
jgi:predicted RNase H-like nuclease (RuvC/YqgF family)